MLEQRANLTIMSREKAPKPPKKRKPRSLKALADSGQLTPLQARFAIAWTKNKNAALAAKFAGYRGPHYAQQGFQVLQALREKAPDVIANMGITLPEVIDGYILEQMHATETKFFQREGKVTDQREVRNWEIQHKATRTLLELMNAFPPEDPIAAQRVDVSHIVIDIPRPIWPNGNNYDVGPTYGNAPKKELAAEKSDPRPKD